MVNRGGPGPARKAVRAARRGVRVARHPLEGESGRTRAGFENRADDSLRIVPSAFRSRVDFGSVQTRTTALATGVKRKTRNALGGEMPLAGRVAEWSIAPDC